MKNLITLFIFFITFNCYSQTKSKILGFEEDKVNHFTVGYMSGFISNAVTYKLLTDHTNINLKLCKFISFGVGTASGFILGNLKEKYDTKHGGFYNKKDLQATGLGSFCGSITITIITFKCKPISRCSMQDLYDAD